MDTLWVSPSQVSTSEDRTSRVRTHLSGPQRSKSKDSVGRAARATAPAGREAPTLRLLCIWGRGGTCAPGAELDLLLHQRRAPGSPQLPIFWSPGDSVLAVAGHAFRPLWHLPGLQVRGSAGLSPRDPCGTPARPGAHRAETHCDPQCWARQGSQAFRG